MNRHLVQGGRELVARVPSVPLAGEALGFGELACIHLALNSRAIMGDQVQIATRTGSS